MIFAGFPATITLSGTFFVTIDPEPTTELLPTLKNLSNVSTIVLDGTIDKSLVINAEKSNVKHLIGNDMTVRKQDTRIDLLTTKEL